MNLEKYGRKITLALLGAQGLISCSGIMVFTISPIAVVQLAHNDGWTGVPVTIMLIGAAAGAYPAGLFMDRVGRRKGLSLGNLVGIAGALVTALAVIYTNLPIFLLGMLMIGFSNGIQNMARYSAAEANPLFKRARAISLVVLGGTIGSIGGPVLLKYSEILSVSSGIPSLGSPWFFSMALIFLSLLVINMFLRPDPLFIARMIDKNKPVAAIKMAGRSFREIWRDSRTKTALGSMIFGQLVMYMVMTITPLHMHNHQLEITSISLVIMFHTLGMYGLSFATGWLADKLGRRPMILAGGLILICACIVMPLSDTIIWLSVALFLLGLGWNFCYVAGSALIVDILRPYEKGKIQGLVETLVNITAGIGSFGSGLIYTLMGFRAIILISLVMALVLITLSIILRTEEKKVQLKKSY